MIDVLTFCCRLTSVQELLSRFAMRSLCRVALLRLLLGAECVVLRPCTRRPAVGVCHARAAAMLTGKEGKARYLLLPLEC